MILKNSQHPKGIDMGPAKRPTAHARAGGDPDMVGGLMATGDKVKPRGCPICGMSSHDTHCIKNVGPYLGPNSMFPPTRFNAGQGGHGGSGELGWTPGDCR